MTDERRPPTCAPRLAIVGASVRAAAQSALRAGFEVVGADLFADSDLDGVCMVTRVERYPEGFAEWLAAQRVDGWMYTGGLENHPELIDRMASTAPLWGVRGEALARARAPASLGELAARFGVAWPETFAASEGRRASAWLAKSYRHAGGSGVRALITDNDWREAAMRGDYAQRVVEGASRSAVFVVGADGATPLGLTEQLLGEGAGAFHYRGSIGPLPLDERTRPQLAALGRLIADGLSLVGVVGVDFIDDGERLWLVEVNPRWTASVEAFERACGESAMARHVAACRGEAVLPFGQPRRVVGKRVVIAERESIVTAATHALWLAQARAGEVADVPRAGDRFDRGDPVLTLFALGETTEHVRDALSEREEAVLGWLGNSAS